MKSSHSQEGYFSGSLPPECYTSLGRLVQGNGCLLLLIALAAGCLGLHVTALFFGAASWWALLFIPVTSGFLIWFVRSMISDGRPLTGLSLACRPYKAGDPVNEGQFPVILRNSLALDALAERHGAEGLRAFQFQRYGQGQPIQAWHQADEVRRRAALVASLIASESAFHKNEALMAEFELLSALLDHAHRSGQEVAFYLHHT